MKEEHEKVLIAQAALLGSIRALPDDEPSNLVRTLAVEYYDAFDDYSRSLTNQAKEILDRLEGRA
jgi:hypothetical protein